MSVEKKLEALEMLVLNMFEAQENASELKEVFFRTSKDLKQVDLLLSEEMEHLLKKMNYVHKIENPSADVLVLDVLLKDPASDVPAE